MNIMEIVSGTCVNGAMVACHEMTRALAERGHELTVVCRTKSWVGQQLENTNVHVVESDLGRWPLDELRRVTRIAHERRIDVLHTHLSRANFFGVLLSRMSGIPSVATANNRYIQLHWMFNRRVIAACEATRKFHCRYNLVSRRRSDVVYNFIDHQRFDRVTPESRRDVRRQFGIDPECPLLGIIGNVIPRKGMLYLIRAMPRILSVCPNARLLAVGFPHYQYAPLVKQEAERLGVASHVVWSGAREDIPEILGALDVYVLPSLEESFPLAILEAMASRLPVVATSVGGIPECVIDQQTGYLVKPRRPRPLADVLIRLLRDAALREAMGQAGRERLLDCFSKSRQIDRLEGNLRQVVDENSTKMTRRRAA